MQQQKNIKPGKIKVNLLFLVFILFFFFEISTANNLEKEYTEIKVLDKISSKNTLIKIRNGKELKHKDLLIKIMKCKNSEFDDNPEITAYIQVRDVKIDNKDDVFIFNGWMFSSSPSITPFDHPVYDIRLIGCY
tara:strand:- start:151 stop:552 length:402 start_codon:yes stop_codon:yes gene_type:complete